MKWLASIATSELDTVARVKRARGTDEGDQPWTILRSIWAEGNRKSACAAATARSWRNGAAGPPPWARTCGKCHTRSAENFRTSKHYAISLQDPEARTPTCGTCHGDVAARLPDPEQLRTQCEQCHNNRGPIGHAEYPAGAKVLMVEYVAIRTMLDEAAQFIPLVVDTPMRVSFETDQSRAELGLAAAAEVSHSMNYDIIEEKLTIALERVVALIRRVMSSQQRPVQR